MEVVRNGDSRIMWGGVPALESGTVRSGHIPYVAVRAYLLLVSSMVVYGTGLVLITCVIFLNCGTADRLTSYTTVESELVKNLSDKEDNLTLPVNSFQPQLNESVSGLKDILDSMGIMGLEVLQNQTEVSVSARMKMSDFMLNPMMLVPQLIMWGFAPILLANLKMFVMQALMLNKMALSSAIFMTLRNIVFGPRPGPIVKYANYGYGQGQNKVYHYHKRS